MKNTLTLLALVLSLSMSAQNMQNSPQRGRMQNFTPEQHATLKSKQMALHLDLNKQQQSKIYALILNQEQQKNKFRNKRRSEMQKGVKPIKGQRYNRLNKGLDAKLAFQNKLKNILNDKQYTQWKKEAAKRAQHRKMAFNSNRKRGHNNSNRNRF